MAVHEDTGGLPVGLFGSSTGAAAALRTAADRPDRVGAVVSHAGRLDLVGAVLHQVHAPTRFIVGGADTTVLALTEAVAQRIEGPVRVRVVPNATHLFENHGVVDEVADTATDCFARALRGGREKG